VRTEAAAVSWLRILPVAHALWDGCVAPCRPWSAFPCSCDVCSQRGGRRGDPHRFSSARRVIGQPPRCAGYSPAWTPKRRASARGQSPAGNHVPGSGLARRKCAPTASRVRPTMTKTPQSGTPPGHELPGRRQGLPPGALKKPFLGPQGDEHRDSPPNAPSKPPLADLESERREPSLKPKS
jgi:hypothetical protein